MKYKSFLSEAIGGGTTVKLSKSSVDDREIKDILDMYATSKKLERQQVQEIFVEKVEKYVKYMKKSEMNAGAAENAATSVAFDMLGELDVENLDLTAYGMDDNYDLLDSDYFFDLTQFVLGENAQFFPLRNPFHKKAVKPKFFISPDHLPSIADETLISYAKDCQTAFCTPNAEMVFSRKFSEQLAVHALVTKIKPKSKKYVANGGKIPNHYCYLEMVMVHELMHFSAGDHFYTKKMSERIAEKHPEVAHLAGDILNYVGDFINNWMLVQSGYEQLPMGLFSEKINYDNFSTYDEMVDYVAGEFKQMTQNEQEEVSNAMSDSMDEHMENENDKPSNGGENSESTEQGEQGQGEQGQGEQGQGEQGQGEQGQGEQGQGEQGQGEQGQGEQGQGEQAASSIDDALKKNQEKISKRDDGNDDAASAMNRVQNDSEAKSDAYRNKVGEGSRALGVGKKAEPIHWKKVLKVMIPSGAPDVESSYSKLAPSAISTMTTIAQTGIASVKAGEIEIDSDKKGLVFVIDNSGSVFSQLAAFNNEILNLLKTNKKKLSNMYIIKFSRDFELYKIDIGRTITYRKIEDIGEFIKGKGKFKITGTKPKPIAKLFEKTISAGTYYTKELHDTIKMLHDKSMNVIMFTDDDLVSDERFSKFFKLAKRPRSVAMFITDDKSYNKMVKKFGKTKWMTVLK